MLYNLDMSDPQAARVTPWAAESAAVATALNVDPTHGLSQEEVSTRRERHGANEIAGAKPIPRWLRFIREFRDPLTYLLLGSVAVSFGAWAAEGAIGIPIEAVVILVIVLANAVLGFAEENRAEQAVAALQRLTATSATVLRGGQTVRVESRELVPGDILVLNEGDAVAADARLLSCANLKVSEASLTGESESVLKHTHPLPEPTPLADRVNMVYKGTAISSGVARAVVVRTGIETEMGHIARLLEQTQEEPSPLEREIERVGKTLGLGVIVVAVVVVATVLLTTPPSNLHDAIAVLLLGVSLAVAAVPEGLPAVLSVVLAIGVQRMAKQRAIVKKLSSVETLGSTSVICSDKTGTLTCNEMTVQRVVTRGGSVSFGGIGYRPEGALTTDDGAVPSGELKTELGLLLRYAALANNAQLTQSGNDWTIQGDPTEAALLVAKAKWDDGSAESLVRIGEIPFTSDRKLMSVVVSEGDRALLLTKGAPDVLLGLSASEQGGTEVQTLTSERSTAIQSQIDALSDLALRPLAIAYRTLTAEEHQLVRTGGSDLPSALERELTYVGLVGMLDPPREEAAEAIREARGAGIRTLMITGDHPRTAARIAEQLGLSGSHAVVTGQELEQLSPEALQERVHRASVFARVAPEHKLRIVAALQARGEIVAMTGDGVNDAPALKAADIGIAMGITGTDVSKEAAKMILADDNFATIIAAVREGRLIFHNISGFLRYLLSSNTGEVFTVFFGVIGAHWLGLTSPDGSHISPLLATQILWINLLTDAAPALALGIDHAASNLMARPPRDSRARIIDRPMLLSVVYSGAIMAACTLITLDALLPGGFIEGNRSVEEARSAAFTVLVLTQLFNCLNSRSHATSAFVGLFTNPWLWGALVASLLLQVLVIHHPWLNHAFQTAPLSLRDWGVCLLSASLVFVGGELRKVVVRWNARRSPSTPRLSAGG
jgi:P-type Ca2+ transporter type 2C